MSSTVETRTRPECPRCHGAGVVDLYTNGHYEGTAQCGRCNSSGVARAALSAAGGGER